jgi:hypothetical protein
VFGKRAESDGSDHPYLDHVGRDSFYGFLALHREESFSYEGFAELYCPDNGRPSVCPTLLATALLLQAHDGVSDAEAKAWADFEAALESRALGIGLENCPFAKSTLQLFRACRSSASACKRFSAGVRISRAILATTCAAASSRSLWTPPTSWAGG